MSVFLGRGRYERPRPATIPMSGCATGIARPTVKTTAGPVTLQRPKVRDTTERFASQLFGKGVTKTNALEALVIAGFVRDPRRGSHLGRGARRGRGGVEVDGGADM